MTPVTVGQALDTAAPTADDAPIIDSNGLPHFFIDPDEPSLRDRAKWRAWSDQMDKLERIAQPSEAQEAIYHNLQVDMCAYALPTIARGELEGLKPGERSGLLFAFLIHNGMDSSAGKEIKRLRDNGQLSPLTGSPSSHGSNGSMA